MTATAWEHRRDVREALQTIVSDPELGIAALSNAPAMSNLLKDLLPDAPRETRVQVAVAEAGVAQTLLDHVSQGMDAGPRDGYAPGYGRPGYGPPARPGRGGPPKQKSTRAAPTWARRSAR